MTSLNFCKLYACSVCQDVCQVSIIINHYILSTKAINCGKIGQSIINRLWCVPNSILRLRAPNQVLSKSAENADSTGARTDIRHTTDRTDLIIVSLNFSCCATAVIPILTQSLIKELSNKYAKKRFSSRLTTKSVQDRLGLYTKCNQLVSQIN